MTDIFLQPTQQPRQPQQNAHSPNQPREEISQPVETGTLGYPDNADMKENTASDEPSQHLLNGQSHLSIRSRMRQFFNQPKPELALLLAATSTILALLYVSSRRELNHVKGELNHVKGKLNEQSRQITVLNEKFAVFDNRHIYAKDEKPPLAHIENNSVSDIIKASSDIALDSDAQNKYIILEKPDLHITLPSPHSVPAGLSFEFFGEFKASNDGSSKPCFINVANSSTDRVILGNDQKERSIPIHSRESVLLVADKNSNGWHAINRNAAFGVTPGFAGSLAQNGWQRLPGGLIMQWGIAKIRTGVGDDASNVISFTRSFPQEVLGIHFSHDATGKEKTLANIMFLYQKIDRHTFFARADWVGDHHFYTSVNWFAFGY